MKGVSQSMPSGQNLSEAQLKAFQFLLDKRLAHYSQRRNYEWRSLFGFLTLIVAAGAAILDNSVQLSNLAKVWLGVLVVLSSLAVITFLFLVQMRDSAEERIIRYLDNAVRGVLAEAPSEKSKLALPNWEDLWFFLPAMLFIFFITGAFLVLLYGK